ncbi:hypothetical protein DMB65_18695 [Flavobacterium cheongpyeongense]|jgi:hypothetical protein|uniref:Uncharacterized protein n=1 Tax=Flavobacterium cheongpyeongense TaxID=2212651 RepID=A0A2V4BJW3_9FLAO|nr:hypothetical protein [Flavobacterium cheongpyeongense]PXY39278.1 hypothetical protein DMB65_18695 [Flavobacterium cheongpyeongense]
MKKTILITIAVLFSTLGHAKFIKAVLYMEDGTKKTGLAEMVENGDSKVIFKTDEAAKKEKIASKDVKKIEYTDGENEFLAERFYLTSANTFSGKFSKSKEKKWFYILYDRDIKIGCVDYAGTMQYNAVKAKTSGQSGDTTYFFGKKKSDELYFGFLKSNADVAIHTETGSNIKKMSKEAFAGCQKLINAIDKEDFKNKTALQQLISIFERNKCK